MAAETLPYQNGSVVANSNDSTATTKKSRESERRRRRRKQKKINKASEASVLNSAEDSDDAKETTDSNQVLVHLCSVTLTVSQALVRCLLYLFLYRFVIDSGFIAGKDS